MMDHMMNSSSLTMPVCGYRDVQENADIWL